MAGGRQGFCRQKVGRSEGRHSHGTRTSPVPLLFPGSIFIAVDTRLGSVPWLSLAERIDHLSASFSLCRANVTVPQETRLNVDMFRSPVLSPLSEPRPGPIF